MLADGTVDVAVTYNAAAEQESMDTGAAVSKVYAFRVCDNGCLYYVHKFQWPNFHRIILCSLDPSLIRRI